MINDRTRIYTAGESHDANPRLVTKGDQAAQQGLSLIFADRTQLEMRLGVTMRANAVGIPMILGIYQ